MGLGKVTLAELTTLGWDSLGKGQLTAGTQGNGAVAFGPSCLFILLNSS